MAQSLIQPSFAAGELAPALAARVDLAKYHVGAKTLRNLFVHTAGGVSNRPGTLFVGRCKDSAHPVRLIPFQFSTVQTYVLEFGHLYMRVVMDGGHVLEPALAVSGMSQTDPCALTVPDHGYSDGDEVFVGGLPSLPNGRCLVAGATASAFQLLTLDGAPIDATGFPAYAGGATVARVFTLATPYAGTDLALLKYTQSADVLTLCHPSYPPMDLNRTQHWVWTLVPITFQPQVAAPSGVSATPKVGGSPTWYYSYVVTALVDDTGEESRGSAAADCTNAPLNQDTGIVNTIAWSAVAGASRYCVYKAPVGMSGPIPAGAIYGFIGSTTGTSFDDANIAPDTTQTPPQAQNPFAGTPIASVTVANSGSGYTTPTLTVGDPTGSGAVLVPAVASGVITGVYVQNGGANYSQPTVTVTDSTGSGAVLTAAVASGVCYPGCATYYQERKVFAGSATLPETVWMTRPGNYANMDVSIPSRDDDSITVTVAAQQVNAVRNLVSVNALLVLTASAAFKISGGSQSDAVTPSQVVVTPQCYNGCADVPPLVIDYDILYVQAKGSIVRDLSYNFYADIYTGSDMTVMSSHLFFGHQIQEWCWAEQPYKLVWAVRDDGILLCLTYLRSQDIYAWTRHDTQGLFVSVASVSEGDEDAVYVAVSRTIPGVNGGQPVQYVERLASRDFLADGVPDVTQAWFVDCGLRYSGTPAATVTGLSHLEGARVAILADGNVQPPQVVAGGAVTIQHPASTITVGLPYSADLQTLDIDAGEPTIQGKRKKISAVTLRLENTRGLKVGPDQDRLVAIKERRWT